jgi:hypothetical protein
VKQQVGVRKPSNNQGGRPQLADMEGRAEPQDLATGTGAPDRGAGAAGRDRAAVSNEGI